MRVIIRSEKREQPQQCDRYQKETMVELLKNNFSPFESERITSSGRQCLKKKNVPYACEQKQKVVEDEERINNLQNTFI